MFEKTAKHIMNTIANARHILLVPHQHPDGDALGSCTAFMEFLSAMGKSHAAFCATPSSPRLAFLPQTMRVVTNADLWRHPELDLIIVFDSGDLRYAGIETYVASFEKRPMLVVIDHHITNERYGDMNLVDPGASSTAELVYRFFKANNIVVTPRMATALLTGILTDTDNFTNAATTASAFTIGSNLILHGADAKQITASVFQDKTIPTLHLWGIMLSRLTRHDELNLVYTHIAQEDLRLTGAKESDIEGMANYMNMIGDTDMTLILKELESGACKGSLRTTKDVTDVSRIAKTLGGGGHKKAAGFTVSGPIPQAIDLIIQTLYTLRV